VICCIVAALVVGGSTRFRRSIPVLHDAGALLLGAGLGGLLVEGFAAVSVDVHWLHQGRHPLGVVLMVGAWAALSAAGLFLGEWTWEAGAEALLAIAACSGAIVTEVLDFHVAHLHVSPAVPATILVHAPSVALGMLVVGMMILRPGVRSPRADRGGNRCASHVDPSSSAEWTPVTGCANLVFGPTNVSVSGCEQRVSP
jgi:hypothetical protein